MTRPDSLIVLRAGRAEAGVAPAIGGSLTHFHWSDRSGTMPWLRATRMEDADTGPADRLACFPLVPFSNRIRKGRFTFGGRTIALPLNQLPQPHAEHGHGWQAVWTPVTRTDDTATIEYVHAADAWPFPYRAQQAVAITEDDLRVTLSIENTGTQTMPAGLGLHPYFPATPRCTLATAVDAMWATDVEVMPTALVAADPRFAAGDGLPLATTPLDNAFTGWRRSATIRWPERRARLVLDADGPLGFLVVYSPPGEGYFCAEPVSHCTDAFNLAAQGRHDTGMLTLAPGDSIRATVRFRPTIDAHSWVYDHGV